ncbi:MAG: bifunctional oligoribonuclease/PAP phosphatase NrnA [Alkalibacterium sp.]|uniref:DHH family phosphoesterase n=1 Tax=Alkalibacterium sp. TaxID=1872447 RepID=UPI003970C335
MQLKSENLEDYEIKKAVWDIIKEFDTIIIHRHVRPDPDAIGSQCGLKEIIKASFPDKSVYVAGASVDDLNYLGTMDYVERDIYDDALVIVTDTANIKRIDGENYRMAKQWIKIDHHPLDDSYGEVEWINTEASSCSEMVADLWLTFPDEITMTSKAARLLYGGIVGDTNRFLYDGTSPYTMKVAGELMAFDFSHTELNDKMNEIEPTTSKMMGYALENFELSEDGLGHIILTQEILKTLGVEDSDTHPVVPFLGKIAGVKVWAVFVEQPEGTYRCRLRSKGPVINTIASNHGGGGHPLASGAHAKDMKEIEVILKELKANV